MRGKVLPWICRGGQRRGVPFNDHLMSFYFVEKTFCGQPVSFPLVLVAQQGQEWVPVVCPPLDLWLTDLLNCCLPEKAARVCLACAKSLCVDCFPGIWAWNLCFSNLLGGVQLEHVSGPPPVDISLCGESALCPPPPTSTIERGQQSFPHCLPRKACCATSQNTVCDFHGQAEEVKVDSSLVRRFETLQFYLVAFLALLRVGMHVWANFAIPRGRTSFPDSILAALPHLIRTRISLWWHLVSVPFTVAGDHISDPLRNTVSSTPENANAFSATSIDLQGSISGFPFTHACGIWDTGCAFEGPVLKLGARN